MIPLGRETRLLWSERQTQTIVWLLIAGYAVVVTRSAWLMDDAFITFRTVDNFVHGYGLTWNTTERVQAYTNPLWMLLVSVSYFATRDIFYTPILLSIAVSVAAVALVARRVAHAPAAAVLGLLLLINSKSFIDYSTSGLENPLTHLTLAAFYYLYLRRQDGGQALLKLVLVASLGLVNRMDTILFFLPALAHIAWLQRGRRALAAISIGLSPFILWELFSIIYYGFPFPNTAYAKLNTGISRLDLIGQGLYYLLDSVRIDPLTPLAIAVGVCAPLLAKATRQLLLALGIVLYLLYVLWIGGDFMSGRFLSAPLMASAAVLVSRGFIRRTRSRAAVAAVVLLVGLTSAFPPLLSGADYGLSGVTSANGIADERAAYFQGAGLLSAWNADPGIEYPDHEWARGARAVRPGEGRFGVAVWANVGLTGYYAGPNIHVIDPLGLGDPLLARLPPIEVSEWGIGHLRRVIPDGYYETVLYGDNRIVDDRVAEYYEKLCTVTRGQLLTVSRLREVWRLNTGAYDDLIDEEKYRRPSTLDRLVSDTYEEPRNASLQWALGKERLRTGDTVGGMAALKTALRLQPTTLSNRLHEADFAHGDWADHLQNHLKTAAASKADPALDAYDIYIHYTWVYAGLRRARAFSEGGEAVAAKRLLNELIAHCRAVLIVQRDGSIYHLLGTALQRSGRPRAAAAAFRQAALLEADKETQ